MFVFINLGGLLWTFIGRKEGWIGEHSLFRKKLSLTMLLHKNVALMIFVENLYIQQKNLFKMCFGIGDE